MGGSVGTRGSPVVAKYNIYRLRGRLFRGFNPQADSAENIRAEQALAESLRAKGFGVWAGHHDGQSMRSVSND